MIQHSMHQHIATPRRRLAAETTGPGAPPAGPAQNGIPQGQCFVDIMSGVGQAALANGPSLAGGLVGSIFGGSWGGAAGAVTAGLVNATIAGVNAANASVACQQLDNAAMANELGVSGIVAP